MSELTVTVLRLGLLVLLWVFVLLVARVLKSDLYGTRVVNRRPEPAKPRRGLLGRRRRRQADQGAPVRSSGLPRKLVVTTGPLTGTSLPLRDSGMLIGRNPECDLVLDDEFASGRHARILRARDGWYVEDLGSTNGTYVGQYRVGDPVPLQSGGQIRIGRTVIELRG